MKIPLTLNNNKIVLSADPSESLLSVLRKEKIYSVKCGCQKGICGNCMVLLDNKAISSCIIPIGLARGKKIITLEQIMEEPLYEDIMTGFSQAGITLCGYCNAGKILTAYSILISYYRPTIEQIEDAINGLHCCCIDNTTFKNGILYAVAAKYAREGKKQNARK